MKKLQIKATLIDKLSRNGVEIALLGLVLLAALGFRLWQLDSVPAGLHYDEVIDLDQALRIVKGERPIYVTTGWGREALYYYLVAITLQFVSDNLLALRLTAVLCSLGSILITYFWARSAFNRSTALLGSALLGITFWPLLTGRFAVRNASLPLLFSGTVFVFWFAWALSAAAKRRKLFSYAAAGVLLGLTMYTYQPARFTPFIFLLFVLYLFLFHRAAFKQNWRGFVLMGVTAVLVVLPLVIVMQRSEVEMASRDWLIEPMLKLLEGDPRPAFQNGINTFKMFSFAGDPLVAYNVPGRPVFVPVWTSLFFYVGVGLALWRWRQPVYAFLLIWLLLMLFPTVLTAAAPNFNRAVLAQTAVMLLTAIGMTSMIDLVSQRGGRRARLASFLLIALTLGLIGSATWRDYFHVWPQQELIPTQYNAAATTAGRYFDQDNDPRPVLVNTRSIEDADPITFSSVQDRPDLVTRWVDTGQALVMPAGYLETRLLLGTDRWIDSALSAFAGLDLQPYESHEYFALYDMKLANWQKPVTAPVYHLPVSEPGPTNAILDQPPPPAPFAFRDSLRLRGVYLPVTTIRPGDDLAFLTNWDILQDGEAISLAFFVHMLDENYQVVAQQDGLGFPPHSWYTGDRMVHVHHLQTAVSLFPGTYWVQFGLYRRETGERWLLNDELGDRLVIGPITVQP